MKVNICIGFVDKRPSKTQGQGCFLKSDGRPKVFGWVHKIWISLWATTPVQIYLPPQIK